MQLRFDDDEITQRRQSASRTPEIGEIWVRTTWESAPSTNATTSRRRPRGGPRGGTGARRPKCRASHRTDGVRRRRVLGRRSRILDAGVFLQRVTHLREFAPLCAWIGQHLDAQAAARSRRSIASSEAPEACGERWSEHGTDWQGPQSGSCAIWISGRTHASKATESEAIEPWVLRTLHGGPSPRHARQGFGYAGPRSVRASSRSQ